MKKEAIEKDYEILSFLDYMKNIIYENHSGIIKKQGIYTDFATYDYCLKQYSIDSVRRLSDGVVFKIGDLCNPNDNYKRNKHVINRIWIDNWQNLRIISENYELSIDGIEHSKYLLFVAEDEIEVFDRDKYWFVDHNYNLYETIAHKDTILPQCISRFSTKEAAKEWVLHNKKLFSLQQVLNILNSNGLSGSIAKEFIKEAKL